MKLDIRKKLGSFSLDIAFETSSQVIGILGPSGCGKSTLLKSIAGIIRPDEGLISLDGRILFDSKNTIDMRIRDRKVGYLFQTDTLFPSMTVRENISCAMHGEKKASLFEDTVRMLHIENILENRPSQLSRGQSQRVTLARMLCSEPEVLLLDEPFSSIDNHLRRDLQSDISSLIRSSSRQALIVSHNPRELRKMTDYLLVMDNGHILQCGETQSVFSHPSDSYIASLLEDF